MNVVTVAFYCSRFVAGLTIACHPPNDVNRQWTAALGAIEGDEPSLTTVVAVQVKVSLINNTESDVIFLLVENAILQSNNCSPTFELIEMQRRFSRAVEAKLITLMNHKPIPRLNKRNKENTRRRREARENVCERVWISTGFISDWIKKLRQPRGAVVKNVSTFT